MIKLIKIKPYHGNTDFIFDYDGDFVSHVTVTHCGDECGADITPTAEEWVDAELQFGNLAEVADELPPDDFEKIRNYLLSAVDCYY